MLKRNLRATTKILLVVIAIVLIMYDFIPFFNPESGDTISEVIKDYGIRMVTLPLVFGTLMGHFFAPVTYNAKQYPKILMGILMASIGFDLLNHSKHLFSNQYPWAWILIGMIIGAKFWQQNRRYDA